MTHGKFVALVGLCLSSVVVPLSGAKAWGPDGHNLIAESAFNHLSPALQARFKAIMAADISVPSVDVQHHPIICRGDTIEHIANWADCVRYSPNPTYSGTAPYHFVDIELCSTPPTDPCPNGQCGVGALQHYIAVVRDANSTPRQRAEALAFIVHIVGDLHQPLHAIDNGDRGGNRVVVHLQPQVIPGASGQIKFHALWDTPLVHAAYPAPADALAQVDALAAQNATLWQQGYTISSLTTQADVAAKQWVQEAHKIAVRAYGQLGHPPGCHQGSADGGAIGVPYVSQFAPIVKTQIAMAAVHLRDVLTATLS